MWKSLLLILCLHESVAAAPLRIVGSSTVYPFAATVAEHVYYKSGETMPLVESTGTGAGIKLFCGPKDSPDGVVASRPITEGERKKCSENHVTFQEFVIGQDGLVLFQKKGEPRLSLTLEDLTRTLDEDVRSDSKCIANPNKTWKNIQANLPDFPIHVLGPAPTSGTYDILSEKINGSCGPYFRHDGVYIEAPTNENLIIQKVLNGSQIVGIVTYSYYEKNRDKLDAIPLSQVSPSMETIQNDSYPLSRKLYLYIKTNDIKNHPGRILYAQEFTSHEAVSESGYLKSKGLIPLPHYEQIEMAYRAKKLEEE